MPDFWAFGGWKMLATFRTLLKDPNWAFLYSTTNGSYVNTEALERYVANLPATRIYAGRIYQDIHESWVSGSSILLSRDVVDTIVVNSHRWQHHLHNDLALGRLLREIGIQQGTVPSVTVTSPEEVELLSAQTLLNSVHFRCKVQADRLQDVEIMLRLHARLEVLQGGVDSC